MRKLIFLLLGISLILACHTPDNSSVSTAKYAIIPKPVSLIPQRGFFSLPEKPQIFLGLAEEDLSGIKEAFNKLFLSQTPTYLQGNVPAKKGDIHCVIDPANTTQEGYKLSITPQKIHISASKKAGFFYAIQSLKQLMQKDEQGSITFPSVEITDYPRFAYRGMHLDVARHFYDVQDVKRHIDLLAYHKFNHFHWHLTEDQGWRIEIKKYPKLTEIGAWREGTLIGHYNDQPHQFDGKRYGGFYTQEEVKEVVKYAQERCITIIPEIEMPGHAQAAIAAYPYLGCTGQKLEVWQKWGISDNVFCPTEETFSFLEDVLKEVVALFPGKYIHIGGDECPKTQWKESPFCQQLMKELSLKDEHELQSYFIQRIERFLNAQGKQVIGWDEILEGGLAPNATVMSWRGAKGGQEAAESGHDVIMTPTSYCYFDYYQSDHPDEPLAIGGFLPLEKVYSYEPIPPNLSPEAHKHVLGAQANVWTEYIPTREKLDYMAFPRACAMAEVGWVQKEQRNFDDFVQRLLPHMDRLEAMSVQAANHLYELKSSIQPLEGKILVSLNTLSPQAKIRFTLDGSKVDEYAQLYQEPILLEASSAVKARSFEGNAAKGRKWNQQINFNLATAKPITLAELPHEKYSGGGIGSLNNGVRGSSKRYGDAEWLGFAEKDLEAKIDLGEKIAFQSVVTRFFKGEGQWIYLPKNIQILISEDGKLFEEVKRFEGIETNGKIAEVTVGFSKVEARFLKIIAENHGIIAEGRQGAGYGAWLFVDEIEVY